MRRSDLQVRDNIYFLLIEIQHFYTNIEILMKDVMTSFDKLVLGYENDSIRDCQKLMVNNKIRHLPIIAEADRGVFEYITVIILFNISFVNLFFN